MSIFIAIIALMLFTAATHAQEIAPPEQEFVDPRSIPPNNSIIPPAEESIEEPSENQASPPPVTETPLEEPVEEPVKKPVKKPVAETPPEKSLPVIRRGQRPYGAIFKLPKQVTCNDTPVVEKFITEGYKEIPFTIGVVKNKMAVVTTIFMVYVHPRTRAFSIVEHSATGISCILAEGIELELMGDSNIIDPNFKGEDYAEQWPEIDPSK